MANLLYPLITSIWTSCHISPILSTAILCPIPKTKTPGTDPSKYRPISLLPTIFKLVESLILYHIKDWTESNQILSTHQYGFRSQRSILHPLASLRMISENLPQDQKLYCLSLDTKKAFDSVWRNLLFKRLLDNNISLHLLKLIMACYNHSSTCIRINNQYSTAFRTTTGVLQGSLLSLPYMLFINPLISIINEEINPSLLTNLFTFADDIYLIATNINKIS